MSVPVRYTDVAGSAAAVVVVDAAAAAAANAASSSASSVCRQYDANRAVAAGLQTVLTSAAASAAAVQQQSVRTAADSARVGVAGCFETDVADDTATAAVASSAMVAAGTGNVSSVVSVSGGGSGSSQHAMDETAAVSFDVRSGDAGAVAGQMVMSAAAATAEQWQRCNEGRFGMPDAAAGPSSSSMMNNNGYQPYEDQYAMNMDMHNPHEYNTNNNYDDEDDDDDHVEQHMLRKAMAAAAAAAEKRPTPPTEQLFAQLHEALALESKYQPSLVLPKDSNVSGFFYKRSYL